MFKNFYRPPEAVLEQGEEPCYAGFWLRVLAALIDTVLFACIVLPVLTLIYGTSYWQGEQALSGWTDFILSYLLPALATVLFWLYRSATPGKMALRLKVVDAVTGEKLRTGQAVGRYLAYYVSILPLLLGLIWVAFDRRKQGWHDKLAGTVVIRTTAC